jgi:hypothetical protein
MRPIALVLSFVGCVAAGMALGFDANVARQQGSETSASSSAARLSEAEQPTRSSASKAHKRATTASDDRGHSSRISHTVPLSSPARSKPASQPNQVQHHRQGPKSANLNRVHQSTATKPAVHAAKVANTPSSLIRPVAGSAVDGRQFRLGRNTALTPAIGGSGNAGKNLQALNGTRATRRH